MKVCMNCKEIVCQDGKQVPNAWEGLRTKTIKDPLQQRYGSYGPYYTVVKYSKDPFSMSLNHKESYDQIRLVMREEEPRSHIFFYPDLTEVYFRCK